MAVDFKEWLESAKKVGWVVYVEAAILLLLSVWMIAKMNAAVGRYGLKSRFGRSLQHYDRGNINRAQEAAQPFSRHRESWQAYVLLARLHAMQKHSQEARAACEKLLKAPDARLRAIGHCGLGATALRSEKVTPADRQTARKHFEQAVREDPTFGDPHVHLAVLALLENDPRAAAGALAIAQKRSAFTLQALAPQHNALGMICLHDSLEEKHPVGAARLVGLDKPSRLNLLLAAEKQFQNAADLDETWAIPRLNVVLTCSLILQEGLPPDQREQYTQRLRRLGQEMIREGTSPEQSGFLYGLWNRMGLSRYQVKDFRGAVYYFQQAVQQRPKALAARFSLVEAHLALFRQDPRQRRISSEVDKGLEEILARLRASSPSPTVARLQQQVLVTRARLAWDQKRPTAAAKLLSQAVELEKSAAGAASGKSQRIRAGLFRDYAALAYREKDYRAAHQYFKKSLAIDPGQEAVVQAMRAMEKPPQIVDVRQAESPEDWLPGEPILAARALVRSSPLPLAKKQVGVSINGRLMGKDEYVFRPDYTIVAVPRRPLDDGVHTVRFFATDGLGLKATPAELEVRVDTSPPVVKTLGPGRNAVVQANPIVITLELADAVSGLDLSKLNVFLRETRFRGGGSNYQVITDGAYSYEMNVPAANLTVSKGAKVTSGMIRFVAKRALTPGRYVVSASFADRRGHVGRVQWSFKFQNP